MVLSRVIGAFIPKLRGIGADEISLMLENGRIVQFNSEMVPIGIGAPDEAESAEVKALDALFFAGLSYEEN